MDDQQQHTSQTKTKASGKNGDGQIEVSSTDALSARQDPVVADSYPLKEVQKGNKDKRGREIKDVLWAVKDFKIFKTDQGVSPHFSDDENVAEGQRERYLELGPELARLNHLIHLLPKPMFGIGKSDFQPTRNYYEREMARGVAQAMTGDAKQGKDTLASLAKMLEKRLRNKGRVIYFAMCLLSAFLIIAVASFYLGNTIGINSSELALVAVMGSIGALLSTAAGLRNVNVDASATLFMSWVYGGQRMLVGVLGAIVLYLMVRAGVAYDLIPGATETTADNLDPYKLAFVSVLAGFSERMVPNLLDRQANDSGSQPDDADGKAGT